ncbi:protein mab-21-like 3 [Chelonia mydas]|uniref:protein mab-21-like 3 n=1 Tax=Chelonia mydas TaxID=8469 RepID=UPI0018A2278A|nr:protein mab-21-like 3 [Chelonia mydas]
MAGAVPAPGKKPGEGRGRPGGSQLSPAASTDPFGREQEQRQDRDASTSQPERRKFVPGVSNVKLKDMNNKPKCPAVQLTAKVKNLDVSIDLVPTIRNKGDMPMDWPQQDLRWLSDWWDQEQDTERIKPTWNIKEIDKTGTSLVAKGSYWRLTYSLAETQLLKDIDADGGHRWLALRVLKKINKENWRHWYGKVLTSYHLKTVLFWASHLNPETKNWATLMDSVRTLLKVLEFSLEKRHLPSYFLHSINLFDWRRTEEENSLKNRVLEVLRLEVRLMRCSPEPYLQLTERPQVSGPFIQRAWELNEFRREHQKDIDEFKKQEIPEESKSMDSDQE